MRFMKKKVLKFLQVSKVVHIGLLRPAAISQVILEVVKVVDIGLLIQATLPQGILEALDVGTF